MSTDDLPKLIEKWGKYVGFLSAIAGFVNLAANNKIVAFVLLTVGCVLLEFWFWTMWHQGVYIQKTILKGEPPPSVVYTDKQRNAGKAFFFLTPVVYVVPLLFMMSSNFQSVFQNPTSIPTITNPPITNTPIFVATNTSSLVPSLSAIPGEAPKGEIHFIGNSPVIAGSTRKLEVVLTAFEPTKWNAPAFTSDCALTGIPTGFATDATTTHIVSTVVYIPSNAAGKKCTIVGTITTFGTVFGSTTFEVRLQFDVTQ